jgi:hypothetical protein
LVCSLRARNHAAAYFRNVGASPLDQYSLTRILAIAPSSNFPPVNFIRIFVTIRFDLLVCP